MASCMSFWDTWGQEFSTVTYIVNLQKFKLLTMWQAFYKVLGTKNE